MYVVKITSIAALAAILWFCGGTGRRKGLPDISEGMLMSKLYVYRSKKDHRERYIKTDDNGNRSWGSYPRILMEEKLGRPLEPDEDVHHIDEDVTNNDLSNLEVVKHGEHQRKHSTKYIDTVEKCQICGCNFVMKGSKWARLYVDLGRSFSKVRGLTCGKSCAGKLGSGSYEPLYAFEDRLQEVEKLWLK